VLLALAAYKGDAGRIKNDKNGNAVLEQDVEDSSQDAQHVEGPSVEVAMDELGEARLARQANMTNAETESAARETKDLKTNYKVIKKGGKWEMINTHQESSDGAALLEENEEAAKTGESLAHKTLQRELGLEDEEVLEGSSLSAATTANALTMPEEPRCEEPAMWNSWTPQLCDKGLLCEFEKIGDRLKQKGGKCKTLEEFTCVLPNLLLKPLNVCPESFYCHPTNRLQPEGKCVKARYMCGADVVVQAEYENDGSWWRVAARLPTEKLLENGENGRVEVGSTLKDGCKVVYSLLCSETRRTTLRQEVAPCKDQFDGCKRCNPPAQDQNDIDFDQEDVDFRWVWTHSTRAKEATNGKPNQFKFNQAFNNAYAGGHLKDTMEVRFTPTTTTCGEKINPTEKIEEAMRKIDESMSPSANEGDSIAEVKTNVAMLKDLLPTVGCDSAPVRVSDVLARLRKKFVDFWDARDGPKTAGKRFDDTIKELKVHASGSPRSLVKAFAILADKKDQDILKGIPADDQDLLEKYDSSADKEFLKTSSTSLVQSKENLFGALLVPVVFFVLVAVFGVMVMYPFAIIFIVLEAAMFMTR